MATKTNKTDLGPDVRRALEEKLEGRLVTPEDPNYDEAREVWNGMHDFHPGLIARPITEGDVQSLVDFVVNRGVAFAVRGGGHNVAGTASVDDGLVIDLSDMNEVHVDRSTGRVEVQGGAIWADVDAVTQQHGLAVPGGVVSDTGVGGLTLGGGIGHLRRKHGLTVDNLVGARIVTPDGELRQVDKENDSELFWGLRGGGGNFGIVTRFDFMAHPVGPDVAAAFVLYPSQDYYDILTTFEEVADEIPEELSPLVFMGTVPEDEEFDAALWGEGFLVVFCPAIADTVDEGWEMLKPLVEMADPLVDMSDVMPFADVQAALDDEYPSGELRYYWKSLNVDRLTPGAIETIGRLDQTRPSPLSTVDVWVQGGAMNRVAPEATAFGDRNSRFLIGIEANWEDPAEDDANIGWARGAMESLREYSTGKEYLNFPGFLEEGQDTLETAYGHNYARLASLKQRIDPGNRFDRHLNIEPRS